MRIHEARWLRAASALIDWSEVARRRLQERPVDHLDVNEELSRLKRHGERLHVVWSLTPELGVPREPFTVWWRTPSTKSRRFAPDLEAHPSGTRITWQGRELVSLTLNVTVNDPNRPVGLYLLRDGSESPLAAVGAATRQGDGSITAWAPFATSALLVNAQATGASVVWLDDVIADDGSWQPLERVGHPVEPGELGAYRAEDQGFVVAPTSGPEAAVSRLERGAPPLGWWWQTETFRQAPRWEPPQPPDLVREARDLLFPPLTKLFDVPEYDQIRLVTRHALPGPQQDNRTYTAEPSQADVPLLRTLLLTAGSDAFGALTTGFATAYAHEHLDQHPAEVELLVTARYDETPYGPAELAAYLPPASRHGLVAPVVGLEAVRAVLSPPAARDEPFRESIEILWQPTPMTATLTGPTASVLAGFGPADPEAKDLLPPRLYGGSAVRVISSPKPDPAHPEIPVDPRPRHVDPSRELPYEGSVIRGYAVAQTDLFGVFSSWQDVSHQGDAPALLGPRIVTLSLRAQYVDSPLCPAQADVEVAVPWLERTPEDVEVLLVTYPMPTGATPPPAIDPDVPPTGAILAHLGFTGDEPTTPSPGVVVGLDENGAELSRTPVPPGQDPPAVPVPRPAGTLTQGDDGRRYRLSVPVGPLDFSGVSRWGVRVFARLRARHHLAPSAWSPRPLDPATAVVASPVPVLLPPPPQVPWVPLASTPDQLGRNHVRVEWADPGNPQVDRIVIWETAESVVRERLGLPAYPPPAPPPPQPGDPWPPAPPLPSPGQRLLELRTAYDAAAPGRRKQLFRRLKEVSLRDGLVREVDVELPRGSRDLHFFVATTLTTTGLEQPWPSGPGATPAHAHLQVALAPTVIRPATPVVRPGITADGVTTVSFETASAVPVVSFELFATLSPVASREAATMGMPRAVVPATATGTTDPVTGNPRYAAVWPSDLTPSWDPWRLRATAVPQAHLGQEGVLGDVSTASEVATLVVRPSDPPDLDPLVAEVDATGAFVIVRSATRAPERAVAAGSHRLLALVDGVEVGPVAPLDEVPLVPGDPAGRPALGRRARAGGFTPLAVWLTRADPTAPVTVTLRLTDPLARVTTREVLVPGWVPPLPPEPEVPPVTVTLDDPFRITGRGTVLRIGTNLPPTSRATLRMVATKRRRSVFELVRRDLRPDLGPVLPDVPVLKPVLPDVPVLPRGRTEGLPFLLPTTSVEHTFVIAEIPTEPGRPGVGAGAHATARPDGGTDVTMLIALEPTSVRVEVHHPAGGSASASWSG